MSATSEYMQGLQRRPFWQRLGVYDWVWALLVLVGTGYANVHYASLMDGYEVGILWGTAVSLVGLGWAWKPVRTLSLAVAVLSLAAIGLYGGDLAAAEQNFFLKYLIASQSAIMWMSALYVMATAAYFLALFIGSEFSGKVGSALTWSATAMGLVGLMVRWRESYLLGPDIGYIPVSNLYEVFILFAIVTALIYLFYERRFDNRAMGAFVLTAISGTVAFLLWYTFERGAHEIQPLVPALQSYWMKIHVPANFVGYGAFAIAAMLGIAYLVRDHAGSDAGRQVFWVAVAATFVVFSAWNIAVVFQSGFALSAAAIALAKGVLAAAVAALVLWALSRPQVAARLPSLENMDDLMYRAIALGFAFFTVATVLGAMWAAEAWGGYWSWDPKETWALIVWLNYAGWLHLRLVKGWRGAPLAWWAIVGLFVTLFAFLGVNMFLSGLHSYGEL